MKPLTIINDTHLGVNRVAGTTPRSALALRDYALTSFERLVNEARPLCILGDLFDQYTVPNSDFLMTYQILHNHCASGTPLYLVAGNHDLSKDSSRMSSFELLGRLLTAQFPNAVLLMEPGWVQPGIWVIPHCINQDRFDDALANVPEGTKFLLLHANYNNFHAEQADHSLNVSEAQALELVNRGIKLIFAHEHQYRTALDGAVLVIGNQIPSSVADCLGPSRKFLLSVENGEANLEEVMKVDEVFERRDWRLLGTPPLSEDSRFIRVEGEASAAEAADVVSAIAKYRARSDALVITNAVKIEGIEAVEALPESLESAKAFDVLGAILETLDPPERTVVKRLMEDA